METGEEGRDAEGSCSTTLSILLLRFTAEACDVFECWLILVLEAETLTLKAYLIDENTGVSLESCKSEHQMLVNTLNLADGARVLKLCYSVFLNGKHNAVIANYCNSGTSAIYSFKGVLNLEELTVRRENSVCYVVRWHFLLEFLLL